MKMRCFSFTAIALLCILIVSGLAGCRGMDKAPADTGSVPDGSYRIYYTNPEGTALVWHGFSPQSEDFEGILREILNAFMTPDTQEVRSALPEQVQINSTLTGINELGVDFNAEYLSLSPVSELLLRGALVSTLLQLPGVDTVRFTVESQSLVLGDKEIGPMTEDTFIIPSGEGINSYRNADITLYFPSADGVRLVRERRRVYYSSNLNKERLVIEQMLKGPGSAGLLPVAVDGTLVQDVSVSHGFCIVDFSEEINNDPVAEVIADPESVIYAFTDAIIDSCPEDHITGVRFRIGGSSELRFREQVNLDQVFLRNAELIDASSGNQAAEADGSDAQEPSEAALAEAAAPEAGAIPEGAAPEAGAVPAEAAAPEAGAVPAEPDPGIRDRTAPGPAGGCEPGV